MCVCVTIDFSVPFNVVALNIKTITDHNIFKVPPPIILFPHIEFDLIFEIDFSKCRIRKIHFYTFLFDQYIKRIT